MDFKLHNLRSAQSYNLNLSSAQEMFQTGRNLINLIGTFEGLSTWFWCGGYMTLVKSFISSFNQAARFEIIIQSSFEISELLITAS